MRLLLPLKGSIQNPTFSPDGNAFLVTRFRNGYSIGAADLYIAALHDRERVTKVTGELDGATNVAQPGFRSTWTPKGWILFCSDHGGPMWPHVIRPNGQNLRVIGSDLRAEGAGYSVVAASSAPSGEEFVFERRKQGEDRGEIVIFHDAAPVGGSYKVISGGQMDARNPQWSPDGKALAWQQRRADTPKAKWQIVTFDVATQDARVITPENRNFYEPTFKVDCEKLAATSDNAIYEVTSLGKIQAAFPVEHPRTYWIGRASWSPDFNGKHRRMLCEASDRDTPEGSAGTLMEFF